MLCDYIRNGSFRNFRFRAVAMVASTEGLQAKSSQIFQDDMFIPSRVTREFITDTYSSAEQQESYHAGACAKVPFVWESQPGTPKHKLRQTPLPPLTPPPSFFSNSAASTPPSNYKKTQTRKLLFPKFSFIRSHHAVRLSTSSETSQSMSSLPSSWPSSSPTMLSSPVAPLCDYYYCRRYGFQFEAEEEKHCHRSSTLYKCSPFQCFSSEKCNRRNSARRSRGCSTLQCSGIFKRLIGISTS